MGETPNHDQLAVKASTDEQAFTELYNVYIDQIYAFVVKRVGHKETAEDIVSEIFRKVFLNLGKYNPEKATFRTWVYRIAGNTMIDHFRSTKNPTRATSELEEAFGIKDDAETPHEIVLTNDQKAAVQALVSQLPDKYQQCVQLKYFAELSNQEIAETLEISTSNVGVVLHRALKKLQDLNIDNSL